MTTDLEYAALDAINASSLKILYQKSPLHFMYSQTHPREETASMTLGTAVHMAILEPERFASYYIVAPDLDKRAKEYKAFVEACGGRPFLSADQAETVLAMQSAVERCEAARPYLLGGEAEKVLTWTDEETGIACKGRLDLLLEDGTIVDLKTARDISARPFASDAAKYGYLFSLAFYHDGCVACGIDPPEVVMVAAENSAPFDCIVYRVCADDIDVGREMYRTALTRLAKCRETGRWPGRFGVVQDFVLPPWAYPEEKPETLRGWKGLEQETMEASDE
jgi:exodeoxyribonuclease VIII